MRFWLLSREDWCLRGKHNVQVVKPDDSWTEKFLSHGFKPRRCQNERDIVQYLNLGWRKKSFKNIEHRTWMENIKLTHKSSSKNLTIRRKSCLANLNSLHNKPYSKSLKVKLEDLLLDKADIFAWLAPINYTYPYYMFRSIWI